MQPTGEPTKAELTEVGLTEAQPTEAESAEVEPTEAEPTEAEPTEAELTVCNLYAPFRPQLSISRTTTGCGSFRLISPQRCESIGTATGPFRSIRPKGTPSYRRQ